MKILVCIKQVPETSEVKINPKDNTLIREGISTKINPDDKAGIELALRVKDINKETEVTVITMGPRESIKAIKESLAMGVDKGILVTGSEFRGADTYATALTLSEVIKKLEYDLVITGRHAIDGETGQVGPEIAENLGIPQITHCTEVDIRDNTVVAKRQFEDRHQIIEAKMPCLITIIGEKVKPRYMTVGGIFDIFQRRDANRSKKDRIKTINYEDLEGELKFGINGSPTEVIKMNKVNVKENNEKLTDLNHEEAADAIFKKMIERGFI